MSALEGLTPHQVKALRHIATIKDGALVRSREVGEAAAKALEARGLVKRWTHEHTRSTPRKGGFRLQLFRIEYARITDAGKAAAQEAAP